MSLCPKQHASKSIQTVKHLTFAPACSEPLLFLYPGWFRLESNRQFHTGRKPGQDRRTSILQSHESHPRLAHTAKTFCAPRRNLCTTPCLRSSQIQPRRIPVPSTSRPRRSSDTAQLSDSGTVLSPDVLLHQGGLPPPRLATSLSSIKASSHPYHYIQRIDADKVFAVLKSFRPERRPPAKEITEFSMSTAQVQELWGTASTNMWIHHDGGDCVITVRPDPVVNDASRITLEGSAGARETASQYIWKTTKAQRTAEDIQWIRRVHASSDFVHISDLPQPSVWTVRNFFEYVKSLVRPRRRRSLHRQIYPDNATHHQAVGQALHNVFSSAHSQPFASIAALRLALQYCSRNTELSNIAPDLWKISLQLGLQPDISCSNYELNRCLVVKDGRGFETVLRDLSSRGVMIDAGTWILALRYADTTASRLRILQSLAETDMLQVPAERRRIAATLAKLEIGNYLGKPDGVKEFLHFMSKSFGADWMTVTALRGLLQTCRRREAHTSAISDLLSMFHDGNGMSLPLDKGCILELFRICRKTGNLMDALELLRSEPLAESHELRQEIIETLFVLAWEKKHFNLCRLFWHVGACHGKITWEMQKRVKDSIKTSVTRVADPEERAWLLLAGKIIVGTDLTSKGFDKIFPFLSSLGKFCAPTELLLHFTAGGNARNDQLQLGNLLVERDLNAWVHYCPMKRQIMLELVDKALALDQEWKASDAAQTTPPRQLLGQALRILLKKRDKPLSVLDKNSISADDPRWFIVKGERLMYDDLRFDNTIPQNESYLDDGLESAEPDTINEIEESIKSKHTNTTDSQWTVSRPYSFDEEPSHQQSFGPFVSSDTSSDEHGALAAC